MGNLLKIIVWIAVLSLVFLAFGSVFKSCNNDVNDGIETATTAVEGLADGAQHIVEDVGEELFEDNDDTEEIDYASEEVIEEEIIEEEIIDEPVEDTPRYTNTGGSSGQYMLIAGNYLVQSNGNEMIKKLNRLGYSDAELVNFDESQYHTVIASRYTNYNESLRSQSNLKAKGIDCYVKRKS